MTDIVQQAAASIPTTDVEFMRAAADAAAAAEAAAGCAQADEEARDGCTGSDDCPAPAHQHGCFTDLVGRCSEPEAHTEAGAGEREPVRADVVLSALTSSNGVLLPAIQSLIDQRSEVSPYLRDLYANLLRSNDLIFASRQDERAKVRELEDEIAALRRELGNAAAVLTDEAGSPLTPAEQIAEISAAHWWAEWKDIGLDLTTVVCECGSAVTLETSERFGPLLPDALALHIADLIIAAGWTKPVAINTVDELLALPKWSVIITDEDNVAFQIYWDHQLRGTNGATITVDELDVLDTLLPATLIRTRRSVA